MIVYTRVSLGLVKCSICICGKSEITIICSRRNSMILERGPMWI